MNNRWPVEYNYRRFNPASRKDRRDFLYNPLAFLPYRRLYKNLTRKGLLELLQDARRLRWEVLDLSECGLILLEELGTLPEELGTLSALRGLTLSNVSGESIYLGLDNTFIALPDSIGNLSNLQVLDLGSTHISTLPDSIGNLSNLQVLDLGSTYISTLPDSIGNLKKLQDLDLAFSNITALPDSIGNLSNLQSLNLKSTRITALPDSIGNLKKLKTLNLSNLHLSSIPYSAVWLGLPFVTNDITAGNCVNLTGVTLDEGDITLFSQPQEVIDAYFQGKIMDAIRECKVIFLGDGGAGKSSLIERIEHDAFQENAFRATDGIKMTKWETAIGDKPLTVRFLDFGGQEIMHSMHRCFLTSHTVYVVVCESRDDAEIDGVAARWMETVKSFAPDCPVLLVLNKSDVNPNVTVDERKLRERNENYRGTFIRTSAKVDRDPGVAALKAAILEEVPDCLSRLTGNEGMLKLKQRLEDMRQDYLTPKQYQLICGECGVAENLRGLLLGWFKDLGVAYSYDAENLRNVYVLNPAWLTNGIYRLILRTPNGGFLSHKTIRETLDTPHRDDMLPDKTYTEQETRFILHIMREFEISLEVAKDGEGENGEEMIPMKMEKTAPARYDDFPKAEALHFRWTGNYIPNNLIHRLMIRKYDQLNKDCVWRTGGWFWKEGCNALAEMDSRTLDLYVTGSTKSARLQYAYELRYTIRAIRDSLNTQIAEVLCYRDGEKEGTVKEDFLRSWFMKWHEEIPLSDLDTPVRTEDLIRNTYGEEILKSWKAKRGRNPDAISDAMKTLREQFPNKEDIIELLKIWKSNGEKE